MKYFMLLLCFFVLKSASAQMEPTVFELYKKKYNLMISTRGASADKNYVDLISGYNTKGLKSNEDFALVLKNLFPEGQGIGVLFFFYDQGVLHRTFLKPGVVIETKKIAVSPEKLAELQTDLLATLNVTGSAANRAPKLRGVKVSNTNKNQKKVSLAVLTKEITALLLPAALDTSFKQLVIIPALNIGTFPFHVLKPYQDDSYLIDRCSFTISPGIVDLIVSRTGMLKEVVGGEWVGNQFRNADGNTNRNMDHTKGGSEKADWIVNWSYDHPVFISNPSYPKNLPYEFPDLPGAKLEIANAVKYAPNHKVFEGTKAIKDSVLKYWEKTDLLYFATHGIAEAENPMENSYLVLSGQNPKLTAKDIMNLANERKRFPELVILSACQTGLGKSMEVGVIGLARSFITGGTKQVMMSLWNVDDEATAFLMNRLLYYMTKPKQFFPSEPLRLAMLDAKAKYPEPRYWASFSVFGLSY